MENPNLIKLILESNLINFVIAVIFIFIFLAKFLPDSTKKRKEELAQELLAAEKAKKEAEQKLLELEQQIKKAKEEATEIISNAKISSEKIKKEIFAQAKNEIDKLNSLTIAEINQQKNTIIESVKKEIAAKVYELTEKSLIEKSQNLNKAIVNKSIKELEELKS